MEFSRHSLKKFLIFEVASFKKVKIRTSLLEIAREKASYDVEVPRTLPFILGPKLYFGLNFVAPNLVILVMERDVHPETRTCT